MPPWNREEKRTEDSETADDDMPAFLNEGVDDDEVEVLTDGGDEDD